MLLEIMLAIYAVLSLSAAIVAFTEIPGSWAGNFTIALFVAVTWPLLFVVTAFTCMAGE